jgi:hypothetical protein
MASVGKSLLNTAKGVIGKAIGTGGKRDLTELEKELAKQK